MPEPLYTSANCRTAYQLHWSLTLFATQPWPKLDSWRQPLQHVIEPDGIRLLEFRLSRADTGQLLISTKPEVSPVQIVSCVKGRLQYLIRTTMPRFWRRHYSISSVGDANNSALQGYVSRQVQHHPMADPRMAQRLSDAGFEDPSVDLNGPRANAYGRFTYNLHLVLENTEHLHDLRENWLQDSRAMMIAACQKKKWLLSRLSLVSNHLHALLGCDMEDAPSDVAISLMNNLAFAHAMKPAYEHSFYVGTFGPYDHDAIRAKLNKGKVEARPVAGQ